jgi:hypothetical protein
LPLARDLLLGAKYLLRGAKHLNGVTSCWASATPAISNSHPPYVGKAMGRVQRKNRDDPPQSPIPRQRCCSTLGRPSDRNPVPPCDHNDCAELTRPQVRQSARKSSGRRPSRTEEAAAEAGPAPDFGPRCGGICGGLRSPRSVAERQHRRAFWPLLTARILTSSFDCPPMERRTRTVRSKCTRAMPPGGGS